VIQPRIRVLIADDSALQRAHLSQLINEQLDMELVGSAASGQDAVRRSSETQPDVVLMDIHMPDMDGIQATWLVSAQLPNGAVIMVTSEERIDFLQKAMSAGAQGYVLKPFGNGEELLRTVRDAYRRMQSRRVSMTDMPAPPPMSLMLGKRIAVIGTKGGVGTTTVATHLALALRRTTQESVIVFDSDLQYGDAALHLALTSKHSIVDLVQRVDALDSATLSRVTTAHPTGVALLDRPPQPELAETLNCNHLRSVMTALARSYDWTVVDTARFYDDKTLAVLDQADIQVIVLTASLGSLRNARQYLGLSERLGYPKDRMCFVLNRANSTGGLSIDDITRVLGTRELIRLPSGGAQLTQAINDGRQALSNQFSSAFDQLVTMVRRLAADVAPSARR
jgi:pilus assembly protein CpaE